MLDTPGSAAFETIVGATAALLNTPIVAISLIAQRRQWFKAITGLSGIQQTNREISFCAHAILTPNHILHVSDTTLDDRFQENPLVTGSPYIRAYAGASLVSDGQPVGTLCVIDTRPRMYLPEDLSRLRSIADLVATILRLQSSMRRIRNRH